ncbi:hypothetical protein [Streptomyces sp. NPDC058299]|uniref:hypothetical protein n=1 Tax=unclassified Streptomyces TaxID=2593676 RepID=UPI0036EC03A6
MSQSPDTRAVVHALDALTTQVRRIADTMTTPGDPYEAADPAAPTTADDGPRCVQCGSPTVRYNNYREQPFCWPCANGDGPTTADGARVAHWRPVPLATACANCEHPYNWHAGHGVCEFVVEGIRCGCTTFTPGDRPEPVDPRGILGVEAPAADEEQLLRWARRESLLVLVTRVQHGRTLTADEARILRQHVETEMREAEITQAKAGDLAETVKAERRRGDALAEERDRAWAERDGAVAERERMRDLLIAENKRANDAIDRETSAEQAAEESQAALDRVRALAEGEYYGITGRAFLAALAGTEQPEESTTP